MLVMRHPPKIAAKGPAELPAAMKATARIDSSNLAARESARWTGIDSLPYLTNTEIGLKFLKSGRPRALARGAPAEACPVIAMADGGAGSSRPEVAGAALERCLAQITREQPACGCQVVALDDVVMIAADQTAYATGTSARLRSAALDLDLLLVAEEIEGGILLRDLNGEIARIAYGPAEQVELRFAGDGKVFKGTRIPVGFRRGRIAERIYASDAQGGRVSLLVGFEPSELAGGAAAWLAWPSES